MVQTLERIETRVPEVAPQRTVTEVGERSRSTSAGSSDGPTLD